MNLLIFIVIMLLVFGLVAWMLSTIRLPDPWNMLLRVALVAVAIIMLLGMLFGTFPVPHIVGVR